MEIKVNGEIKNIENEMSLADLLGNLGIDAKNLAIEHNGQIIEDDADLSAIKIRDLDKLEIVRFVGGG